MGLEMRWLAANVSEPEVNGACAQAAAPIPVDPTAMATGKSVLLKVVLRSCLIMAILLSQ